MEQALSLAMLALAIVLLAVLMRMHGRMAHLRIEPERSRDSSVHQVAIPIRLAAAVLSLLILVRLGEVAQHARPAFFAGLATLPVLAYVNAYAWQFRAVLRGSDLTLMTPSFRTRSYDLTRLIEVCEDLHGTYRLRFQGGNTAWLVKYLSGHSILRRALFEARPYY
ncbi:hypothetical protein OB2597_12913 [Pseudooceanicola batsensis HTCC2597]|uniref:Uncharacterized protein n=1 Tax=Pseudooceanicola batsensis (strain ATCC BAA-863 / DSM 15984 / KCTC 12145 / HTCC2597) TaxID=252305 RepID=A3TY11_PSEBH|nr:hypothetical protein [Pseudooceanicola batsensis]EAQ03045.1 hypothetical protein OB2597_12913 [Pseudooceanicola batsensis HTCC2597]